MCFKMKLLICVLNFILIFYYVKCEDNLALQNGGTSKVINVQKCCGKNQTLVVEDNGKTECKDYGVVDFENVFLDKIFETNHTHYWKMENYAINITTYDPCKFKIKWDNETDGMWYLLNNETLYFKEEYYFYEKNEYCFDKSSNDAEIDVYYCPSDIAPVKAGKMIYFQGTALLLSVLCLLIVVYYIYFDRKRKYPDDCKKVLALLFLMMAVAYLIWSIYAYSDCSTSIFCKTLWVLRYCTTMSYHFFLFFFYIELSRNVSLDSKKNDSKLKHYITLSIILPILAAAAFFGFLKKIPERPIEEDSGLPHGVALYVLFYYLPCGLIILTGLIISFKLHFAQISRLVPDLNETLRRLMRQESRTFYGWLIYVLGYYLPIGSIILICIIISVRDEFSHMANKTATKSQSIDETLKYLFLRQNSRNTSGDERLFYHKCFVLIGAHFFCAIFSTVFYSLSINDNHKVPNLDNYNYVTYLLGVVDFFIYFPNGCRSSCYESQRQEPKQCESESQEHELTNLSPNNDLS